MTLARQTWLAAALLHNLLQYASALPAAAVANAHTGLHLVGGNIVLGGLPLPPSLTILPTSASPTAYSTPQLLITTVTVYTVTSTQQQQQDAASPVPAFPTSVSLPAINITSSDALTSVTSATPVTLVSSTPPVDVPTLAITSPATNPSQPAEAAQTRYWKQPDDFSPNIDVALGIERWAWGQSLVTVLPKLPIQTSASASRTLSPQNTARPSMAATPQDKHVLQVKYPKGSVNPGNKPQGGVGFYASPLNLTEARNVSFTYSVYFPPDFDFVKGGKLPGLYGGHGGCSGGAESEDCLSTRLMFRTDGQGELYLYVPKGDDSDEGADAQSPELCNTPPASYCDSKYGYSIGRGAWSFFRGRWSDVKQDVWLNTPGMRDGGFNVWINGDLVLHSSSVMYRRNTNKGKDGKGSKQPTNGKGYAPETDEDEGSEEDGDKDADTDTAEPGLLRDGGTLSHLGDGIGDVLSGGAAAALPAKFAKIRHTAGLDIHRIDSSVPYSAKMSGRSIHAPVEVQLTAARVQLAKRQAQLLDLSRGSGVPKHGWRAQYALHHTNVAHRARTSDDGEDDATAQLRRRSATQNATQTSENPFYTYIDEMHLEGSPYAQEPKHAGKAKTKASTKPVTFLGIMFDTFFGGSDPSWATPEDQYSYFNSLSLQINS